jgi:bacteriocin-like protein
MQNVQIPQDTGNEIAPTVVELDEQELAQVAGGPWLAD